MIILNKGFFMNIRIVFACFLIVPTVSVHAMLPRDKQIFHKKKETSWFNDGLPRVALYDIFVSGDNLYDSVCQGAELMNEKVKDKEPVAKLVRFYKENGSKVGKDDQAKVDIFGLPLKCIESWKEGSMEFKGFIFACYQLGIKDETMLFQEKLASLKKSKGL